ncbi:SMP-30/gluconolactonase/LRE family protein [Acidianus sulfidivorans JP7]|uniref:Gluconolaconase n=1 Tax=Acidianus sulfidivorans JP7 TaxID=619593 RepID=A0A2U9ILI3_9CREN|nr:SMP-30/gluconolactonase/LRE family protein [Acidianus sulfidivorans]AWR96873.1 SMP-30/gluconolactonase/LRE family protein [Acidianus sulfidivorans JP7]
MVKPFSEYKAKLAEGPVYDRELNSLFWVDIEGKKIIIKNLDNNSEKIIDTGDLVSSLCIINDEQIIATIRHDFDLINIKNNSKKKIVSVEADLENNRFNDGKCDKLGRYWAGTMNMLKDIPTGNLYKLEGKNEIKKTLSGLIVSNGLGWSPDNDTMYLIDSRLRKVYSFDFDLNRGEINNKRVIIDFNGEPGNPDGMTVDSEGYLWIAHWNGGKVSRWTPNGNKVFEIKLPVSYVSSITFGSTEMNEVYITTAYKENEPLSGKVFVHKLDINGQISYRFKYYS